eukprot:4825769-Pyramimonas_sp.AAC.1
METGTVFNQRGVLSRRHRQRRPPRLGCTASLEATTASAQTEITVSTCQITLHQHHYCCHIHNDVQRQQQLQDTAERDQATDTQHGHR